MYSSWETAFALGAELADLVLESRCGGASSGRADEWRKLLHNAHSISIHTLIAHKDCVSAKGLCPGAVPVEVWTVSVHEAHDDKGLNPIFLKNAVRSHLHFSQLNSWQASKALSATLAPTYRLSLDSTLNGVEDGEVLSHIFPVAVVEKTLRVSVVVQYVKRSEPPQPETKCQSQRKNSCGSSSPVTVEVALSVAPALPLTPPSSLPIHVDRPVKLKSNTAESPSRKLGVPSPETPKKPSSARRILVSEARESLPAPDADQLSVLLEPLGQLSLSSSAPIGTRRPAETRRSIAAARRLSGAPIFHKSTGLPLNSSPAPLKRNERSFVGLDPSKLKSGRVSLEEGDREKLAVSRLGSSAPGGCLLGSYEENLLQGRFDAVASLIGFSLQITSGEFKSEHITLPVTTFCFNTSDDTPSPFLGYCSLKSLGKKGYRIPKSGTLQACLFNPQGTVVRVFVVAYDVRDMPASTQTFLRQRTFFMPSSCEPENAEGSWLRYLMHIRLATDAERRLFIHTDVRVLFSRKSELEALNEQSSADSERFQLRSFTEMPEQPKYSPCTSPFSA